MVNGVETDDSKTLLSGVRRGDEAAFSILYRSAAPVARQVAQRIVRDVHAADDLVQEAFYLMLKAVRSGHGPTESFGGYLIATVRRLAYRYAAAKGRSVFLDDFVIWESQFMPEPASPHEDLVNAAWASLPPRWRHILWLIEVDRFSPAELAPAMSLTPNAVSSLATRARQAMRLAYLTMLRAETA